MPFSYPMFKSQVAKHIIESFNPAMNILDVGAGSGVWSDLLYGHFKNIDALEIHEPYINDFNLRGKYRKVLMGDIRNFVYNSYDYLIMGDILEHLPVQDAKNLLEEIKWKYKYCMVAIPYMYPQGTEYGNVHETHHQPDLTHEIFLERYPSMKTLVKDDKYGYYVNYNAKPL
jgi:hypothetical protein